MAAAVALSIGSLGVGVGFLGLSFIADHIIKTQGLNVVHEEGESASDKEQDFCDLVDIVFVHGLGGHPERTWTYNSHDSRINWVKDIHPLISTRSVTLSMHSHRLVAQLAERRGHKSKDRPIIFVAHSLGGLIVKSALVHASASSADPDSRYKSLQLSTIGVLFFGTPHREGRNLEWNRLLTRVMSISRMVSYKPDFDPLALQAELFELELERYKSIEHKFLNFSFYEKFTTQGVNGKTALHAVPKDLALLLIKGDYWHIHELKKTREGLVKFESRADPDYKTVSDVLRDCLTHIQDASRNCEAFEKETDLSQSQETMLSQSKSEHACDPMSMSWRVASFTSVAYSSAASTIAEKIKSHQTELAHRNFGQGHYDHKTSDIAAELLHLYADTNQTHKAKSLYTRFLVTTKRQLARGEEHNGYHDRRTLRIMAQLAQLYVTAGHYEKAESLNKRLLVEIQELYGYFSPERAFVLNQLAHNAYLQGDYARAADLLLHMQKIRILFYDGGERHPETLRTTARLAIIYDQQGNFIEAQQLYREVIDIREATPETGPDHERYYKDN